MNELLLELYSEEMPFMAQILAEKSFKELFATFFSRQNINFSSVEVFSGPCRIAIYATGLSFEAKKVTIRGPKQTSDQSTLDGFCKKHKAVLSDLILQAENGIQYYILHKENSDTLQSLLLEHIPKIMSAHVWPKSMKWGDYAISWIRPLKNILCILSGQVLAFEYGHLTANNTTFGHKFFCNQSIKVSSFEEYKKALKQAFVILARDERKAIITGQIDKISQENGFVLNEDDTLLDEVSSLVEWPVALLGQIPEKFMSLPKELLISCLRVHQKYFTCSKTDGSMAERFIFICNSPLQDFSHIIQGNQKVLSARLSDGLYFYQQDLKTSLEQRFEELQKVTFHSKLGSMRDKSLRLVQICRYLAPNNADLQLAAKLCKCDLISNVVNEFPELQGVISKYYALSDGLSFSLATAISQHYSPQGFSDCVPQLPAAFLGLADKLDSFVGLMLAGERATSSKDPYALRRNAIGILRIILERKIEIDLGQTIKFIASLFPIEASQQILQEMNLFMSERLKNLLSKSFDAKILNAILDQGLQDICFSYERAEKLKNFCAKQEWDKLLSCYKRLVNILGKKMDFSQVNSALFSTEFEKTLFACMQEKAMQEKATDLVVSLQNLLPLVDVVEVFFENVMVNDADKQIAQNRQNLIYKLKNVFEKILKFEVFL